MAQSPAERMTAYRDKLRAAGLRPIQIWVPDTSAPGFTDEARRQSRRVAQSSAERDEIDLIDELQIDNLDPTR